MSLIHVSDFMVNNPVTISPITPLILAAQLMKEKRIGSVIIEKNMTPYGIITERDIVWRVVANEMDIYSLKASDICSKPVITIIEDSHIEDAIELMKEYAIRRLVVVNNDGIISGILTSDDIACNIETISNELALEYLTMSKRFHGYSHNP